MITFYTVTQAESRFTPLDRFDHVLHRAVWLTSSSLDRHDHALHPSVWPAPFCLDKCDHKFDPCIARYDHFLHCTNGPHEYLNGQDIRERFIAES